MVIDKCKKAGVDTSICGQAGSYPDVVEILVKLGISSVSANPDAVQKVRETVARAERKMLLDSVRKWKSQKS
jgi:pyruvate,water dikinase